MLLLSIVPRLPPAIDGVGDYALSLARQLRKEFGIKTHFIVGDPAWAGDSSTETFPVTKLSERSAANLFTNLTSCLEPVSGVLLHYVGYGYAKRGAPFWLITGLEKWHNSLDRARLLTMFHEVYASGPFWTSSFWLSSLQKQLAARLALVSDSCHTSRQGYAEILRGLSGNKHSSIATLPMFSSIGEPEETPMPLKGRKRRLVIFGNRASRLRVYEKSLPSLEHACRALEIEEIFDVGPPIGSSIISQVAGVPVVQTGPLPAAEVSSILSDSVAGFFDYNRSYLAKSTIFAAYCAHRLILMSATCNSSPAPEDGLEAGKHYWVSDSSTKNLDLAQGQILADNAYSWYLSHNLSVHAETYVTNVRAR
jgi:hypothetical protein